MLILIPEWLLYMTFALWTCWGLSTLLLLWLWFREWCYTARAVVTGKIDGDTDKLVAIPMEVD